MSQQSVPNHQGIGAPLRRVEDRHVSHRPRPLRRRHRAAGHAALRVGALAARSCAHPRHRYRGGRDRARRGGGHHRRRHGGRRHGADASALADALARRLAHGRAAALCARTRARAPCRRAGRRGDRGDRCRKRSMQPSMSWSTTSRSLRSPTCAPRARPARRSCMMSRPATSASGPCAATRPPSKRHSAPPPAPSRSSSSTTG